MGAINAHLSEKKKTTHDERKKSGAEGKNDRHRQTESEG